MDDINLNFIEDDFEFNKVNISDSLVPFEEEKEEKEEKTEIKKSKKEKKQDKIVEPAISNEVVSSDDDLFKNVFDTMEEYSKVRNTLADSKKELELLKLDYNKIKNENEYLNKKYSSENEAKIKSEIEIKRIRKDLAGKEKKVLMLKTLLQLIIREYGIEEISKVTRLNIEQLKSMLS